VRRLLQIGRALSPRDRRALRGGLLVLAPALLYYFVARPYVSALRRTLDALQGQRSLLLREEEVTTNLSTIRAQALAANEAARRATRRMYSATDSTLAMTAFGHDVAAALREAGLVVQRVEARDSPTPRAGLRELTIDVRAEGDFGRILTALTRLETNARLIHVSRVDIAKTGEHQPDGAESLALLAVIHGYAQ
jgi:type II secretory pathway component PulM